MIVQRVIRWLFSCYLTIVLVENNSDLVEMLWPKRGKMLIVSRLPRHLIHRKNERNMIVLQEKTYLSFSDFRNYGFNYRHFSVVASDGENTLDQPISDYPFVDKLWLN